jgi:hypothetical protein
MEKRIARLTWNDLGWVQPSGRYGKSKNVESHEGKYGYGHEEWLFDTSKLVNGFHYGFLEPIRKQQQAYSNNTYDVWLYSIHGESKERFWIGEIKNVIVLDDAEAEQIFSYYVQKGWHKEMEDQIKLTDAVSKGFSNWKGVNLFNIKFKPSDILIQEQYYLLPKEHIVYTQSRYSFAHFTNEYLVNEDIPFNFEFIPSEDSENSTSVDGKFVLRIPKEIEIPFLHRKISNALTKLLRQKYGKQNVTKEHSAGYGNNRIDIVSKSAQGLIFYEIKTYNSIRTCIRVALGQILEYSYFPKRQNAIELIIVTQHEIDEKSKHYFKNLRKLFSLPIYYQSYDSDSNTLSEKF